MSVFQKGGQWPWRESGCIWRIDGTSKYVTDVGARFSTIKGDSYKQAEKSLEGMCVIGL
jgi:hypothetical protein